MSSTSSQDSVSYAPPGGMHRTTGTFPVHLLKWQLPPGWSWGSECVVGEQRHYQEVVDALGRSLSLVSAQNPKHHPWLAAEARALAHRNHAAIPTTYHYWASFRESQRGPGYLRRWIVGETIAARLRRAKQEDVRDALRILREAATVLVYLHDGGAVHGALSAETVWMAPMGRLWVLGWQWALTRGEIPEGLAPSTRWTPQAPEWTASGWLPTPASDQWLLGALVFTALTGERPPAEHVPPVPLLRPDCPDALGKILARALAPDPADRYASIASLLRDLDRLGGSTRTLQSGDAMVSASDMESEEARLRWALADDYEVLTRLGAGSFGAVWRVRDLSLGREVALKLLHPHVARDERAVSRFRREARLAAQLAHPSIIPIFDWDARGDLAWYTMELAEAGSLSDLVKRSGPRGLEEIAPQVEYLLDGLAAAHSVGVVHRDLKPENILLDRYRRWRITDFGIANVTGDEPAGTSGTPAFAPPEQLLGETQDAATDCFGVAAIVAYALTGTPPFGDADGATILARELSGNVALHAYPEEIRTWLRRGLHPDASERFSDAIVMRDAWRNAIVAYYERERRVPWWRRLLTLDDEA